MPSIVISSEWIHWYALFYIHANRNTRTHTCAYMHTHNHVYTHAHTHMHTRTHTCIHIYTHAHTHTKLYQQIHKHTATDTYTYTYMYTHIRVYTHYTTHNYIYEHTLKLFQFLLKTKSYIIILHTIINKSHPYFYTQSRYPKSSHLQCPKNIHKELLTHTHTHRDTTKDPTTLSYRKRQLNSGHCRWWPNKVKIVTIVRNPHHMMMYTMVTMCTIHPLVFSQCYTN